jgi:hypothetical protein
MLILNEFLVVRHKAIGAPVHGPAPSAPVDAPSDAAILHAAGQASD